LRANAKSSSKPEPADPKRDPLRALANLSPGKVSDAVEDLIEAVGATGNAPLILGIVDELEAEDLDAKRQQQPLQRIQHAISDLKQVTLGEEADDLDAIAKALLGLSEEIDRLSKRVDKIRSRQ
jgi:cob(I)alamin adenosyltransferase